MKTVGIIVEYNPFHNGHQFHINEARRLTNADYVIAVMSGDFLQRGTPALIDKYSRASMAVNSGADLIIMLPVVYSTASAEYFAQAAVTILNQLGCVDYLCFGSECDNIDLMIKTASFFANNSDVLDKNIAAFVKSGISYASARAKALALQLGDNSIELLLNSPNNILGIEYIKALLHTKSQIKPLCIARNTANYHDLSMNTSIVSATAIRYALETSSLQALIGKVPNSTYSILEQSNNLICPIFNNDFSTLINYKLLQSNDYLAYFDMSKELSHKLLSLPSNLSFDEICNQLKSKNYTLTRIQRAITHILLNIYTKDVTEYIYNGYVGYIRPLAFNKASTPLLSHIKKNSSLPIITRLKPALSALPEIWSRQLNSDLYSSAIYNLAVYNKFGYRISNDISHKINSLLLQ